MKELTPEEKTQRHEKITKHVYKWAAEGRDIGLFRPFSHDTSKIKEGELEIIISQRQNLYVSYDSIQWGPEVLVKSIVYNTIAISDSRCNIEGDIYLLTKAMERLDLLFIKEKRRNYGKNNSRYCLCLVLKLKSPA